MKKISLSIILLTIICFNTFGQNNKGAGIYFGAIAGTQINNFNKHFVVDLDQQLYSFSIGAGSAFTKNNYIIGLEFLYSAANKDNNNGAIQYVGFRNTLSFGYNVSKSTTWKLEPNIGVVINNNQIVIQSKNNSSFQNLINNQVCGNIGLNVKTIRKNGLFTGLKLGYLVPLSGETEWENKVSGTATSLKDNVGAFYIQLNLGGLLDLSKK